MNNFNILHTTLSIILIGASTSSFAGEKFEDVKKQMDCTVLKKKADNGEYMTGNEMMFFVLCDSEETGIKIGVKTDHDSDYVEQKKK